MDRRVQAFIQERTTPLIPEVIGWTLGSYGEEAQELEVRLRTTPSRALSVVTALWPQAKNVWAGLDDIGVSITMSLLVNTNDLFGPIAEPETDKEE